MEGIRRWFRLVPCTAAAVCLLSVAGCAKSALDDAVRAISKSQGVDESTVRTALQGVASTEDEQLRVAQQWEQTLPDRPLPDLDSMLDDMARYGREQLRSATCAAVIDVARTGEVPTGQQFVNSYLGGLATGSLPAGEVYELVQTFDELWNDAVAGTLTTVDVRLTLLELEYC